MPPIRKKMLHILKSEPDDLQRTLMYNLSLGYNCLQFPLYEFDDMEPDYEEVSDRSCEGDEVITWW